MMMKTAMMMKSSLNFLDFAIADLGFAYEML